MNDYPTDPADHPWFDVEMRSPRLITVRDYWLKIKGQMGLPARSDFILTDLGEVVPNLSLVDVEHDPFQLRFRMLGTFITELAGRNSTGKKLDQDLFPDNLEALTWGYL